MDHSRFMDGRLEARAEGRVEDLAEGKTQVCPDDDEEWEIRGRDSRLYRVDSRTDMKICSTGAAAIADVILD
uniref:Uncharacterized protein n=1 Tax=Candidatus Kentrum sp. TC TaxID=2126339 RepID=A0A451ACF5_9GAMM|nr:MAG: hypothetical protein BECKTC1821F_GA0114240_11036 [Candidatus Kentron sp. TC]